MFLSQKHWPLGVLVIVLFTLLTLTLRPYGGNISALFHLDETMHAEHPAPAGFAVLTVPGYDGMLYYDIARRMSELLTDEGRLSLGERQLRSYAYQRILLPVTAFIVSAGRDAFLPFAFLAINILALLGTAWTVLRWKKNAWLYALALALSPAALIALHFNLAEPMTLFLMTVFLVRQVRTPAPQNKIRSLDVLLLSLLVLSREINILFIGLLIIWNVMQKYRKNLLFLMIPLIVFALWHGFIYRTFGSIPFLASADKRTLPFGAIVDVLRGAQGYNRLTISSIAFFLGFILPSLLWIPVRSIRDRRMDILAFGGVAFLLLMTIMAWDIWGSITSIGRVITPVYPLTMLYAAREDTFVARGIAAAVLLLGLAIGLALVLTVHPYRLA